MLELVRHHGEGPLSVRKLAETQGVPYAFARGIQRELVSAGLVKTHRGAKGGLVLARDPKGLTLLDVVAAIQGTSGCSVCTSDPDWCDRMGGCPVHSVWNEVDRLVYGFLGRQDLVGLAKEGK
jgi:Rrf2 family protein